MEGVEPKTLFIDIDGTLIHHYGETNEQTYKDPVLNAGVYETLKMWEDKGYRIILTTSRKESERDATVKQLRDAHIQYDLLIMGLVKGQRVLINDTKDESKPSAVAINIKRNEGFFKLEI